MPWKIRSLEHSHQELDTSSRSLFLPAPSLGIVSMSLVSLGSEVSRFMWRDQKGIGEGPDARWRSPLPRGDGLSGISARVFEGGCGDSGRKWLDIGTRRPAEPEWGPRGQPHPSESFVCGVWPFPPELSAGWQTKAEQTTAQITITGKGK